MIQKKSFQAIDFLSFFLLSPLFFFFFYNLIPWSSAWSTISPERQKQSEILANTDVNIFTGLCFALAERGQKGFICLYRNDKTLNIHPQTQTLRPPCWSPKKTNEGRIALFYWLPDSWLVPLCGVHLLKEDRAKHCSSVYRLSRGIKGSGRQSVHTHTKMHTHLEYTRKRHTNAMTQECVQVRKAQNTQKEGELHSHRKSHKGCSSDVQHHDRR